MSANSVSSHHQHASINRVDWVDVAKGICILLVVLMHATLGVEKATGQPTALGAFIEWARPFRMPDFFLISGLFLAARIDRPWREYLDTKVLHFAYFYLLWLHILLAVKAPSIIADIGLQGMAHVYVSSFVDPFSSLWFIYLLAVYFVVTKVLRPLPKAAVLLGAALLHVLWRDTGIFLADEFASRFVFFYAGYALAPLIFAFAARIAEAQTIPVVAALLGWSVANAAAVSSGLAATRGPDLAISFIGIAAVISASVLIARSGRGSVLRYCGLNSISIYLAFTLFMGPARQLLLRFADGAPGVAVALASMSAGIIGALLLSYAARSAGFAFLFERPASARLSALEARWRSWTGAASPVAEARLARVARGK